MPNWSIVSDKMRKHPVKVLIIGNDEGPKKWFARHLLNKPAQTPVSGISLDRYLIKTATANYDFWCVDSHELYNVREPVNYYQDCQHVLIIPKDNADLEHIINCLQPHIPAQRYIVCIPSANLITPNPNYRILVTDFAKKEFQCNPLEKIQFIESIFRINDPEECTEPAHPMSSTYIN